MEMGNMTASHNMTEGEMPVQLPAEPDWWYSMKSGENVGALALIFIPPAVDRYLLPKYVIYSVVNDARNKVKIAFQTKYSNSNTWLTQFQFYVKKSTLMLNNYLIHCISIILHIQLFIHPIIHLL